MHEVLVNRLGGLSLPRKSVVRLTDRPDMTLDVYRGRKTTIQPTNQIVSVASNFLLDVDAQKPSVSYLIHDLSCDLDLLKLSRILSVLDIWQHIS